MYDTVSTGHTDAGTDFTEVLRHGTPTAAIPHYTAWPSQVQVTPSCRWCGGCHDGICRHVRAIEYYPDGAVKRVEFFWPEGYRPAAWPGESGGSNTSIPVRLCTMSDR
jgi:hypothetical protein